MDDSENKADQVSTLRCLVSTIASAIDRFESATEHNGSREALTNVARAARKLNLASTPPTDRFEDFTFQPLANACVRIALSIGLFDHLPEEPETGASTHELSKSTETDPSVVERVLRCLAAFDIIQQDEHDGLYRHTAHSLIYTDRTRRAWALWIWDASIQTAALGVGPYFDRQTRSVAKLGSDGESPFTVAHGVDLSNGTTIFDVLERMGKLALMREAMSGSSAICAKEAVDSFDFAGLKTGENGVVLVDVGGAAGATIIELRKNGVRGKMVLEDLLSVLPGSLAPDLDVDLVEYDFFKQDQPVKGAGAYFYQRIFHDWSDADAARILDSLKPAMSRQSKLLICDVVVEDIQAHPRKAARDMNMLIFGGMERTQGQWKALLESKGFVIDTIHALHNPGNSIIEARLA